MTDKDIIDLLDGARLNLLIAMNEIDNSTINAVNNNNLLELLDITAERAGIIKRRIQTKKIVKP